MQTRTVLLARLVQGLSRVWYIFTVFEFSFDSISLV
jgi:hypothetical protein